MAAVLGREDGICMISGTGSYVAARKGDAPMLYLGSSGYMLDTGGSGYALGRAALIASQREREGRGPKTLLTEIVERDIDVYKRQPGRHRVQRMPQKACDQHPQRCLR